MLCPKCGYAIELSDLQEDICCNNHEEEVIGTDPVSIGKGLFDKIAMRFSMNQILILGGCIFLIFSLGFTFFRLTLFAGFRDGVFPSMPDELVPQVSFPVFEVVYQSGFSLMFSLSRYGFFILSYSKIFELLVPILAVTIFTFISKNVNNCKLMALIASIVGLSFALSSLLTTFVSSANAGIGLQLFFVLWVLITALAYLEYRNIHSLENGFAQAQAQSDLRN